MKLRLSDKASKVLKFEAKLLLGIVIGGLLFAYMVNSFIYTAADKVAEAYTSDQPLFK